MRKIGIALGNGVAFGLPVIIVYIILILAVIGLYTIYSTYRDNI